MYIGRAMSQKSPLGLTHPDSSATAQSVAIKGFDFIANIFCLLHGLQPRFQNLGFAVSLR